MSAFDRDYLSGRYRLDGVHSLAFDDAGTALRGLGGNPGPDPGGAS